jgi:superfamily I DNA/RNA helicase
MEWPVNPTQEEAQRFFARRTNGHTWELLDQAGRTQEDEALMLAAAYASLYHWRRVGTAANWQRGEWLIARVYAALGQAADSRHHAVACRELTRAHPAAMEAFDLAFDHESMARALVLAGETEQAREELRQAEAAGRDISDAEDRQAFFDCLTWGDWRGLKPASA